MSVWDYDRVRGREAARNAERREQLIEEFRLDDRRRGFLP
jgi:hypothetical protein